MYTENPCNPTCNIKNWRLSGCPVHTFSSCAVRSKSNVVCLKVLIFIRLGAHVPISFVTGRGSRKVIVKVIILTS
jgi:hypothetical protein